MSKKTLIIDDDATIRSFLVTALHQLGDFHFVESHSAKQLTDLTLRHKPDLILLDINIPDVNGFQALEALRKGGHFTPVIMVSAHSTLANVKRAKDLGADGFIVKPFNLEKLKTLLSHLKLIP